MEVSQTKIQWNRNIQFLNFCVLIKGSLTVIILSRNGALDLAPIVRKQRQRASKKKTTSDVTTAKPKELANFEEEEESTTKEVVHMLKHLKRVCDVSGGRVHYFSFLIDPDSFSHSVENLFHFAFLVKVDIHTQCPFSWA